MYYQFSHCASKLRSSVWKPAPTEFGQTRECTQFSIGFAMWKHHTMLPSIIKWKLAQIQIQITRWSNSSPKSVIIESSSSILEVLNPKDSCLKYFIPMMIKMWQVPWLEPDMLFCSLPFIVTISWRGGSLLVIVPENLFLLWLLFKDLFIKARDQMYNLIPCMQFIIKSCLGPLWDPFKQFLCG